MKVDISTSKYSSAKSYRHQGGSRTYETREVKRFILVVNDSH